MSNLLPLGTWVPVLDGDPIAARAYLAHYSSERSRARRIERGTLLTLGPGQKLVLSTPCRRAHFAWRVFMDDTGETGVCCAWFHNSAGRELRSSALIREADKIADQRWPGERHYTLVDAKAIRCVAVPGKCFLKAGWRYAVDEKGQPRRTKERGLLILERPAAAMDRIAA